MTPGGDLPTAVTVYAPFDALYYSFYLEGLASLGLNVRYGVDGFPDLGHHGLALETAGKRPRRIFLSASDGPGLNAAALGWCDVYGKVNLDDRSPSSDDAPQLLAIGPSFPVRRWRAVAAMVRSCRTYGLSRPRIARVREHFANYYRQYRYRRPLAEYRPGASQPDYVFFAATLWKNELETNLHRGRFLEASRAIPGIDLEGGFVPRRGTPVPGFEHLTTDRRYGAREYLAKTRRSAVVFNTPAVSGCHGWKLGEFLALGKAIVSTPLLRALPAPLESGEHLHLVEGTPESLRAAVELILGDEDYRRRLERNARDYYLQYLRPDRVIERVLRAALTRP